MNVVKNLALLVCLFAVAVLELGCNAMKQAGDSTKPAFDLSGSWEVVATSTMNPGIVSYVEYNATQQGSTVSAPVQEFIVGASVSSLANCLGITPGHPQGNFTATVGSDNIQGTYTETSPTGGSASFTINAPLTSTTTFAGNYTPANGLPPGCVDLGTYVATKTAPLSGTYSGPLTYPDGSRETMSLTATEDSGYMTVTGTAAGGQSDGPINLTGNVIGNLAELHSTTPPLNLFAWWNVASHKLYIVNDTGYAYGSLTRQ
jgi:hypothetical protein